MMRYFLYLSYVGTQYAGWQRQTNTDRGIQALIESKISILLRQNTTVIGCGRTDAGVHAMQYFCHFDTTIDLSGEFVLKLNKMLPKDICVNDVIRVDNDAHARYDALSRAYIYHIHTRPNPFIWPYSGYYEVNNLNLDLMNLGIKYISEMEDFRHVCLTPDRSKTTICRMTDCSIFSNEDSTRILIQVTADRFLKSMIRIMVARLIELGAGRITLDDFIGINTGKKTLSYKTIAYPEGLHLYSVKYPYLELEVKDNIFADIMKVR